MMASTHVLAGLLVGLAVAPLAPTASLPVVMAGAAGGLAPDLDALGAHRKDLHAPVYAAGLAALLTVGAAATRTAWLAVGAAFVGSAALHAVSDAADGGRSVRPWAESVDRGVYCHAQGRWWRPRAWVPYDGSPHDLALATVAAGAVVLASDLSPVRALAVGTLALSMPYVLLRKRLPAWLTTVRERVTSELSHFGEASQRGR